MPLPEYSQDELWELYEKLPKDLQYAIFSPDTATNIEKISNRYDIQQTSEVARYVGRVLLGLLSPQEFKDLLSQDLKIDKNTAGKVFQEINAFVFYPVRESLQGLYQVAIETPKPQQTGPVAPKSETKKKIGDTYREKPETRTEERVMQTGPVKKQEVKVSKKDTKEKEPGIKPSSEKKKKSSQKESVDDSYREPIE